MIEVIRFVTPIQFGGEMLSTLVLGKHSSTASYTDGGVRINYTLTNPNNNVKTNKMVFTPFSNIVFVGETWPATIPMATEKVSKDTLRK